MSAPGTLTALPPRAAWRPRVYVRPRALQVAGTALRVDLSCAFGAALTAWTFASAFLPETNPGQSVVTYWTAGAVAAVLVLVSVAAHELGHAAAARRAGVPVGRITLSFVGGTSELVGAMRSPRDELVVAAAGPVASLGVALVAALTHVVLVETAGAGVPATVAALIAVANLGMALLNAAPGLPLDGGRVLRATIWAITGHPDRATRVATAVGRRLGEGLIVLAVLTSAWGFVGVALWAGLVGVVLRENAG